MASYIHQNTDMKVYLFLNLDDYADFEAIQEHYHRRIKWVVNIVETCPFGFLESCPFYGLVEFDGRDANIDHGGAFYSTLASFEGTVIMTDIVDFPEKAKEILAPNAADFPESFDDYLRLIQEQEAYSAAGETWFGWWLVEHYLPYHVNRPNSCRLGEPARGRKDSPYFQVGYGSFDNIPDLVDPFVESFLPA